LAGREVALAEHRGNGAGKGRAQEFETAAVGWVDEAGDCCIAISWETVTKRKPRRSRPSSVAGIASTVGAWRSWARTIPPAVVLERIREVTTLGPGRFQSSGSTDQRIVG